MTRTAILLIAAVALSGCYVKGDTFRLAEALCAAHGGVDYVEVLSTEVGCKDGLVVHYWNLKDKTP